MFLISVALYVSHIVPNHGCLKNIIKVSKNNYSLPTFNVQAAYQILLVGINIRIRVVFEEILQINNGLIQKLHVTL